MNNAPKLDGDGVGLESEEHRHRLCCHREKMCSLEECNFFVRPSNIVQGPGTCSRFGIGQLQHLAQKKSKISFPYACNIKTGSIIHRSLSISSLSPILLTGGGSLLTNGTARDVSSNTQRTNVTRLESKSCSTSVVGMVAEPPLVSSPSPS